MENNRNNTGANAGAAPARIDGIKESVKSLIDSGQEKATAIKDKVVDLQHKAKDKAVDLKDKAVDLQHKAKDRGNAIADRATEMIKAHPFAAVGVAFGIGYIAMRLVRR
ncbi:MAG: DUF883 family protein [Deltaproteobacteria bacterium]|nr:DUF883 family protein [Deltaproteobacteria bacterium]